MARSVAVAGGGIIGLSIAWRLAQRGFRVTVFDQSTMGSEASWAGAGMLAPGGEMDEPSELASMAIESRRLYPAFVRELREASGLAIDFQTLGAVDLAFSEDEWALLEARAGRQAAMGIESEAVARCDVATLSPWVQRERLVGARFYPGDGLVNPREVVVSLCAVLKGLGVRLIQNCAVLGVEDRPQGGVIRTANGLESFDAVVVAAGAWSGLIDVRPVPIPASVPVKGHLVGYQQPEQTCNTIVRHGHTYLMQRNNGLLIVGASVERVGFDRRVDVGIAGRLSEAAGFVMPHLMGIAATEIWVGFRPGSDGVQLGRWGVGGVYLAYGHYRNGILLAPLTAERVAEAIGGIDASWRSSRK